MDSLRELQRLGVTLANEKRELEELEAAVSEKKDFIRSLEEGTIPELMDELGIPQIHLADGSVIKVADLIQARIPEDKETEAFEWLINTNNAGIIKNEIKVSLDRGQDERVAQVLSSLSEIDIPCAHKQSVHPSTLKAFITEALQNPELAASLPKEAFGVYEARKVTFKS